MSNDTLRWIVVSISQVKYNPSPRTLVVVVSMAHDPEQLVRQDVVAAEEVGGLCFGKESTALFSRPSYLRNAPLRGELLPLLDLNGPAGRTPHRSGRLHGYNPDGRRLTTSVHQLQF